MALEKPNQTSPKKIVWGVWATIGFIALKKVLYPDVNIDGLANRLATNGFLLSIAILTSSPVCIGLTFLFVKLRKGSSIKHYLCFTPIKFKTTVKWIGMTILFLFAFDALTMLLNQPVVPESMILAYQTAYITTLLWIAFILAAPLFEEIFFRGFLFEGLVHSRIGSVGAVFLTAVVWSIVHLFQYETYQLGAIFVLGTIFGIARLKTGSIYTTIMMHSFSNLVATVQVALKSSLLGNPS